jgi:ABC-type antimicrobial peptide transport system permease subunit
MALGAGRGDVVRLIARLGIRLVAAGVLAGVVVALVITRFEASLLFGVRIDDPLTYFFAAALLVAISVAACTVPASRAASVDPMQALRAE